MLKKPSKKDVVDNATVVASAAFGAMLSNGVIGLVPVSKLTKPVLAIVGTVLAASISGSGTGKDIARGIALGVGIANAKDVITDTIKPMLPVYTAPNAAQKFLSNTFGMNGFANEQVHFLPFQEAQEIPAEAAMNGVQYADYITVDPLM